MGTVKSRLNEKLIELSGCYHKNKYRFNNSVKFNFKLKDIRKCRN